MHAEHHRGLERLYAAAPCNQPRAPKLEVGDGTAVVLFEADPQDFHGGQSLHGHVIFKALDDAAFFAASSCVREQLLLTADFHVHFLRPVRGGALKAEGQVVQRSRKRVVAEARLFDDRGREVARGSGSFLPSGQGLGDLAGYRA